MTNPRKSLVVAWNGLPAYAAHLIREGQALYGSAFPVLGTQPDVPIEGMESVLGSSLRWIEPDRPHTWAKLGVEVPEVFIHSGWGYMHFNSLADEVRLKGGKVIGMFDNCWKGTLRQILGGVYFRYILRKNYAAAWVPGQSGSKLARFMGFEQKQIYTGMYGAHSQIFNSVKPIHHRPRRILFVGRLTHRKGVLELAEAFNKCSDRYPDWELYLVGNGELLESIQVGKNVNRLPFMQPEQIAELMNESRVFALASREEHWGLVVHEAALCGCALLLQSSIGAVSDLANNQNAETFKKTSTEAIEASMIKIMQWGDERYKAASTASQRVAEDFGPATWARQLIRILEIV